ncbi:Hydroxymethylglutaryl-CoA reductase class I/II NAD/NADP-binding [Penicillium cf. griseofulvum]|uniref:hydroxymethylglutaryl-CoA reductase (NADPH) n=1 Tax=Penicillium cf. griseofulvum TaxID=2972120 RepID=A0A9W9M1Z3_9EURO|nr:Hydroxymethylglutaryl-CoA reductase class I/II NAD/NADP-binding [Penicillium cf. griseofulvum]KAJ5429465.1 Hydroxymethylglutaryl-CoA reductase class I/II NAD/NADP-binding [Penicillium cf. griseofulvum]KAJ5436753.1 Hydroxymethylglutaryl-CoA reductase class I/II NAD/NADP-binding [Penicillium cf. griseofulvum]
MAPDKKPSWGVVSSPRGIQVVTWATLSDTVCRTVLRCTAESLYHVFRAMQEGGIRNGQFGSNINVANVITGIFIATGQDAASVAEGPWAHVTPEYDFESRQLKLTLYFPSLPVGTVGGGTAYDTQQEALGIMGCKGTGGKSRLAGLIATFSLALDISTAAAVANNTFSKSHEQLARAKQGNDSKI